MAEEDKIVPGEENFNEDNTDDETTDDESEMSDDSTDTGSSSDEDPVVLDEAVVAAYKMHLIEITDQAIESIEKEIKELELQRPKVTCPVAQMMMDGHMEMLFGFREATQKRLEEIKHGVQPVQESLKEDNQTLTDLKIEINTDEKNDNLQVKETTTTAENPKKNSAGTSPLGGIFPKQGQERKLMLDLKPGSSLEAEKEMKKGDDDKQLSSNESIAEIKHQKTQGAGAWVFGDFGPVGMLLSVNRAKAKGLKKGKVGDVNADLKGGKETTIDCDTKSNPGNEEKGNN